MRAVVKDVMSTHPISVSKDSSFKEMAGRLRELKVSGFPVLDDNGKVIGVVSEAGDLAPVRAELVLGECEGWHRDRGGTPETVPIGHQVLARIRHVQGVVAVRDRLVYPAPPTVAAPGPYVRH